LSAAQPEPLFWDFRVKQPAFKPGTDYWLSEPRGADVVVEGEAHAPGGKPIPQLQAGVEVGQGRKDVLVRGRRGVRWQAPARSHSFPPLRGGFSGSSFPPPRTCG
jgi:hypothetical protein